MDDDCLKGPWWGQTTKKLNTEKMQRIDPHYNQILYFFMCVDCEGYTCFIKNAHQLNL